MHRFQDLYVSYEKDGLRFKQGNKQFTLSETPDGHMEDYFYNQIIDQLDKHPMFVPINIDTVRLAVEAYLSNTYGEDSEEMNCIVVSFSRDLYMDILARYRLSPIDIHQMTQVTYFIMTIGGIYCVGLGSGNYKVKCFSYKDNRPFTWKDVTKFSSRKQLEELVNTVDVEDNSKKKIFTREDAGDL